MTIPGGESAEDTTWMLAPSTPILRRETSEDVAHFIVVTHGSESGKKIDVGLNPISLGRHHDNQLVLSDPCISGHHCIVTFADGQLQVTDTGSTNGTFIDGKRISGQTEWPITAALLIGNQTLRHEYRHRDEMRRSDELNDNLKHAARYVQSLLPRPWLDGPMTASWRFLPSAELGGDIFDYFWLDGEHLIFYLLDVCGHGTEAALHSVSVFNLLRHRSLANVDFGRPTQVLQALNEAMPMDVYGDMYFTLWYGVYRPRDRLLRFASGGHPPALLFDHEGHRHIELYTPDPPIGVIANQQYHEEIVTLPPGSRIYLYSDGVYEMTTQAGDPWSRGEFVQWLAGQLRDGSGQPDTIFQKIRDLTKSQRLDDDFSLLALDFS